MKAINYYIVLEKIKEQPKSVGGIELLEKYDKDTRYSKAKVVSVGDKVEAVKQDDIVWYDKHNGHGIQFDKKLYHVVNLGDIVIVE
jgi:co-chaperonin GroES (HSP10)|tara:strand:+ start:651 stop:908 length:258 start_codon:yes stop_codon:yes gene_type:complete